MSLGLPGTKLSAAGLACLVQSATSRTRASGRRCQTISFLRLIETRDRCISAGPAFRVRVGGSGKRSADRVAKVLQGSEPAQHPQFCELTLFAPSRSSPPRPFPAPGRSEAPRFALPYRGASLLQARASLRIYGQLPSGCGNHRCQRRAPVGRTPHETRIAPRRFWTPYGAGRCAAI
jgi:hypothetical protein